MKPHIKCTQSGKFHYIVEIIENNAVTSSHRVHASEFAEYVHNLRYENPHLSVRGMPVKYQEHQLSEEELEKRIAEVQSKWNENTRWHRTVQKPRGVGALRYVNTSVARKKFH